MRSSALPQPYGKGSSRVRGKELNRSQTWQEEIPTPANGDESRQARDTLARRAITLQDEVIRRRTAGQWGAVAKQRIARPGQAGELRAHHPRVLQELELPRDVRVQAEEVQAAFR